MPPVGVISYGAGAVGFIALTLLLATSWRGRLYGGLLMMATGVSALWAGYAAYLAYDGGGPESAVINMLEVLRNLAWYTFLLKVLGSARPASSRTPRFLPVFWVSVWGLGALLIALIGLEALSSDGLETAPWREHLLRPGFLLLAVCGLVLLEQVFRNTRLERRWAVKHLCFGLGGMLVYDFYLYADALLVQQMDPTLWQARGFANALVVPLIGISAARNPEWSVNVFLSHRIVFHTVTLVGTGFYLVLMAAAGYYIRVTGGSWGGALQIIFLFGAVVVLAVLLLSGHMRARLKVFVGKHFFHYKYDYREEWLRFTRTLSGHGSGDDLAVRSIQGIAQIVESPAGILYLRRDDTGAFFVAADWNLPAAAREARNLPSDHSLAHFLQERVWVIDLDEYDAEPEVYAGLDLPDWLTESSYRFIVPLMHEDGLLGFMVLARPRADVDFNWEDRDLLKTAGRQVAAHLAQMLAAQALTEARQFETFNQLSAFVVHDLKNLVAQLSLLVRNAAKHGSNPDFVQDMVATVDSSVTRMNRLLEQLRMAREHGVGRSRQSSVVQLDDVIAEAVAARSSTKPVPQCVESARGLRVMADHDRMVSVLSHLIQNAQEATAGNGRVVLRLRREADRGIVLIEDTGTGMDAGFIRNYLFQPFFTTKGGAGMGIGAYEAREFARALGGDLTVDSVPSQGTTVRLEFPAASASARGGE